MRKFMPLLIIIAFVACKSEDDKTKADASKLATSITYAYTADYSSNFEMGNPEHSKVILDLWKDYDNNTFENSRKNFADTVNFNFANSAPFVGSADSAIAMAKSYRSMFSEVKSVVHAFTPLKSTDKGQNWVCVWGTEYDTKDGKTDSVYLQETWRFNKDGKIDLLYQYQSKPPVMAKK